LTYVVLLIGAGAAAGAGAGVAPTLGLAAPPFAAALPAEAFLFAAAEGGLCPLSGFAQSGRSAYLGLLLLLFPCCCAIILEPQSVLS